jgi:ASC-1-like (ASCH) protein
MKATNERALDRVFVPLSSAPFRWFSSGAKRWELRRHGRQYTRKHLTPGRRVELRRGYTNKHTALWGRIEEVREADTLSEFFNRVDFREVIPEARSRLEAEDTATKIIGGGHVPVIGFRVALDPIAELALHADYMPLIRQGKKHSTVRNGVRQLPGNVADLVADGERMRVLVTDWGVKSFEELSAADAKRDGFTTLVELTTALRRFYPNISPSDPVTIIGFMPLSD